jgi:hypothetical protein
MIRHGHDIRTKDPENKIEFRILVEDGETQGESKDILLAIDSLHSRKGPVHSSNGLAGSLLSRRTCYRPRRRTRSTTPSIPGTTWIIRGGLNTETRATNPTAPRSPKIR